MAYSNLPGAAGHAPAGRITPQVRTTIRRVIDGVDPTNHHLKPWILLFIIYTAIWVITRWPALRQAWWYMDDYAIREWLAPGQIHKLFEHTLSNGRPGQILWYLTFLLDGNSHQTYANQALRMAQGTLHVLVATMVSYLCWRVLPRWWVPLATLPFLLWPFSGESVLWRTAAQYPLAAILSVFGVYVLRQRDPPSVWFILAGVLFIIASILTNQSAAFAGLVVWLLLLQLEVLRNGQIARTRLLREGLALLVAYLAGGLMTTVIAHQAGSLRGQFASSLPEKLFEWVYTNGLLILGPKIYPIWLAFAQLVLGLLVLGSMILALRQEPERRSRTLLMAGFLMALTIAPFAAALLVAERWPSWRVMYLGPFVFTSLCFAFASLAPLRRWQVAVFGGLLTITLTSYAYMSWQNASDFVRGFEADVALARSLEGYGERQQTRYVYVATQPDAVVRNRNPYGLTYVQGDTVLPAFIPAWSAHPFLRDFSRLIPADEPAIRSACVHRCESPTVSGFWFSLLPASNVICLCPS